MDLMNIRNQTINIYEQEIKQLTIKYTQLLEKYTESKNEITSLKNELDFFHREMRTHKYNWESMFYTPNELGYMFELENVEKKTRSKSI